MFSFTILFGSTTRCSLRVIQKWIIVSFLVNFVHSTGNFRYLYSWQLFARIFNLWYFAMTFNPLEWVSRSIFGYIQPLWISLANLKSRYKQRSPLKHNWRWHFVHSNQQKKNTLHYSYSFFVQFIHMNILEKMQNTFVLVFYVLFLLHDSGHTHNVHRQCRNKLSTKYIATNEKICTCHICTTVLHSVLNEVAYPLCL